MSVFNYVGAQMKAEEMSRKVRDTPWYVNYVESDVYTTTRHPDFTGQDYWMNGSRVWPNWD